MKKRYTILIICLMLAIIAGMVCYHGYRNYTGPIMKSHTEIGYYGHRRLRSFRIAGMNERAVADKIYVSKHDIDWSKPAKAHSRIYYFPKNMPLYTRRYIIEH